METSELADAFENETQTDGFFVFSPVNTLKVKGLYSRNGALMKGTVAKVKGIVIPTEWNTSGDAVKVSLFTNDEKEYVVENTKRGRELLAYLRQKVRISGQLSERDGKRIIRVDDFSVSKNKKEGNTNK